MRPARRGDNLPPSMTRMCENVGASTSRNPNASTACAEITLLLIFSYHFSHYTLNEELAYKPVSCTDRSFFRTGSARISTETRSLMRFFVDFLGNSRTFRDSASSIRTLSNSLTPWF
jgi:hypothetical protein